MFHDNLQFTMLFPKPTFLETLRASWVRSSSSKFIVETMALKEMLKQQNHYWLKLFINVSLFFGDS